MFLVLLTYPNIFNACKCVFFFFFFSTYCQLFGVEMAVNRSKNTAIRCEETPIPALQPFIRRTVGHCILGFVFFF